MSEKTVTAPLPGLVKRILVGVGQKITEKLPVLIIEAMKMENMIYGRAKGIVKEIYVKEGQNVRAGDKLITIIVAD
jgi:biotin carboxyl carrier protein